LPQGGHPPDGSRRCNAGIVQCRQGFGLLFLRQRDKQSPTRLRIDEKGYSLRGWFRRLELRKDEVEEFVLKNYMNRDLILVRLTETAALERSLENREIPFSCSFGRPVSDVFETLTSSLKK